MARLMAVANGDNTSSSTWGLIDSTSFLESETGNTALTTSYVASSASTPGAITIDGIAVRIASRVASPSGTISIELYNSTLGASVSGTEVTIDVSDLPDCNTTAIDGGWVFFKFSSSVLLVAATNYQVRAKTSLPSKVNLYRDATANNWCRILRTTTTQAPSAGDDRFVMGEWTAAGTTTTRTVTLNDTSTVDYGAASTSVVTPALSISAGGEVKSGVTASTAYIHKISGNTVVYSGGVLRLADTTTRMPTTSSMTWTNDCAANVDFGIEIRRGGSFYGGGATKTRWTTLTADAAATATVMTIGSTTGWATGDDLVFAPTGTTTSQHEAKTISTVDSSTQVTLTAGLTNAHTGTGDVLGEVGNMSSNVKILGTSASVGTFLTFKDGSTANLDHISLRYLGSGTANKRGVDIQNATSGSNSITLNNCVFRDNAATAGYIGSPTGITKFYITGCVIYFSATATQVLFVVASSTSAFDVSGNLIIGGGGIGLRLNCITGASATVTNNNISGYSQGVYYSGSYTQDTVTEISGFNIHSCSTGIDGQSSTQTKVFNTCKIVSCANGAIGLSGKNVFTSCDFYGNSTTGISIASSSSNQSQSLFVTSCNFRGRTSFAQPSGVTISNNAFVLFFAIFSGCNFGSTTAHTTADVVFNSVQNGTLTFNKCVFASTTEITSTVYTFLEENARVGLQRIDGTAGNHKTFIRQGIVTRDTTIFNVASPSTRIEPKSATVEATTKLFPFRVPVNSGQTCTPTLYVRESESGDGAAYNGARVKLYVAANHNLGITSDTLLDTATSSSDGAWEALTGTTSSVTDDGVLEFYITCNGTAGWVNMDDFTASVA